VEVEAVYVCVFVAEEGHFFVFVVEEVVAVSACHRHTEIVNIIVGSVVEREAQRQREASVRFFHISSGTSMARRRPPMAPKRTGSSTT
jgi:hypothetical protein